MITSYFSPSLSPGEKGGASLGNGGAKEGRTLMSRADEECSVKTGILYVKGDRDPTLLSKNLDGVRPVILLFNLYILV